MHHRIVTPARVAIVACALVLAGVYGVPWLSSFGQKEDAPQDTKSDPSATYQANVPFDLVGEERERDAKGQEQWDFWDFAKGWDWTGTMRLTVSDPVVYTSPEAAGFQDDGFWPSDASGETVVLDVRIENVDATCRDSVVAENGAPSLNLSMFELDIDGTTQYPSYFSAPGVAGLVYGAGKAESYTWPAPGESVTARVGYSLNTYWEGAQGTRLIVATTPATDLSYRVVLDEGWSDGAPVVELGAAKTAPEGVTSGE